ncbi:MAG TPA: amino acid adenylation domain-containing protein, partial [Longimicrobiaceae bacterium]
MTSPSAGQAPPSAETGDEVIVFPLSFPQQRLWLIDQLEPGSALYNLPSVLRLRGELDAGALRRALVEVVARHESLRTRFGIVDGEPAQLVHPPSHFALPLPDLAGLAEDARGAEARRLLEAEARRPFDLARGPVLRAALLRLDAEDHLLAVTMHHVVSDGWSMDVFHHELTTLYGAFAAGLPSPLPELPIQYGDYAVWQREELGAEALEEQVAFWKRELAGAPPALDLPTDRPRPPVRGPRGGRLVFGLPPGLPGTLGELSRRERATLFMTLLAACTVLLSRYAGEEDVLVGTPIAGRNRTELEGLIGFFVNTLVVRADLAGDPTFRELLGRVKQRLLGAYAHADVPFERVVEELRVPRDASRTPLFQAMFVLQSGGGGAADAGDEAAGLSWTPEATGTGTAKFDLNFSFVERADGMYVGLDYAADLFDEATILRMSAHLGTLLAAVAGDPDCRVSACPLLPPEEERRVLEEWNGVRSDYPREPVHRQFVERARRTPAAAAAVFGDRVLTYAELEIRSAGLARALRRLGVGPEVRVGIAVDRTPEMLVGLLGILRAGGAYVPLDPASPPERLEGLLEDSAVPVLLAHSELRERLPPYGGHLLLLDRLPDGGGAEDAPVPDPDVPPDALAYVIYTSGSTGKPKGVMVPHSAVANLVGAEIELHGLEPRHRMWVVPPLSFDATVGDIFPVLACGATLVFHPSPADLAGEGLLRFLTSHGVSVFSCPVALWLHFLESLQPLGGAGPLPLPGIVRVGGEAVPMEAARSWSRLGGGRGLLLNHYGPTETTVILTVHPATDLAERTTVSGTVPIGRPIPNTRAYVLDGRLGPVPAGVPGELYLGGAQLARGYLGRPELTAERFLPDPYVGVPGARMYRSGDRARWLSDGVLEYLGRNDNQVKIRGFRIEPGEVEAALLEHPRVREAAVVVDTSPSGEKRLVGYVAADADPAALREHLRGRLPDYMVPALFVPLDSLPLTGNGKVDRAALPDPDPGTDAREYLAPRTETERGVADVWAEVLGLERVGVRDDFFQAGGHSLAAARVVARLRERFGREVPLATLFRGPTVESLARVLDGGAAAGGLPSSLVRLRDGAGTPFFCVHPAG